MSRSLDGSTTTAVQADVTTPYFLVFMDFDTPVRYSTAVTTTFGSPEATFSAASITINWSARGPRLSIFNEGTTFGQTVLGDGTAGRQVTIYQAYYTDPTNTAPIEIFDGVMGEAEIGDYVTIRCSNRAPAKTPRHFANPPTFNHLPKPGTKIETANEVIVLET